LGQIYPKAGLFTTVSVLGLLIFFFVIFQEDVIILLTFGPDLFLMMSFDAEVGA